MEFTEEDHNKMYKIYLDKCAIFDVEPIEYDKFKEMNEYLSRFD